MKNEILAEEHCPYCKRHCSLKDPHCGKGKALAEKRKKESKKEKEEKKEENKEPVTVSLTGKGLESANEHMRDWKRENDSIFSPLTEEEKGSLEYILNKILR